MNTDVIELDELRPDLDDDAVTEPAKPDLAFGLGARLAALVRRLAPRTRRAIVATVVAALLCAGGVATGTVLLLRSDGLPKGVAFQVAGHNVTESQLEDEVQTLHALYGIAAPKSAKAMDAFRRSAAKAYAVSLILDRAASGRHIVIADKQAQDVLTRYLAQQFGNSSDAMTKFDTALGRVGTSEQAVLTEIKRQLAISQLFNQVTAGVTVTDTQVAAEFAKDKASLATPEKRDIRNIVVATKAAAVAVLTKLRHGAPFDQLAAHYSLDASTKSSAGDLGTVGAADLDSGYAKVAFAAAPHAPFGPIQTRYGWNVGEVASIVPSVPAVYPKVKGSLRQQMVLAHRLTMWRSWLGQQIRAADVRYAAEYQPADPDSAPRGAPGVTAPR
jgi:peptidyl-prolyl cis-trans isomerase C